MYIFLYLYSTIAYYGFANGEEGRENSGTPESTKAPTLLRQAKSTKHGKLQAFGSGKACDGREGPTQTSPKGRTGGAKELKALGHWGGD